MSNNEKRVFFLFPGQGSQYRGIGSDLYEASITVRQIYEQASDLLGYDMAKLSFQDPDNQINLTKFTQPVLLTHQYACLMHYREIVENSLEPITAAGGHSLGEYTALVVAGVLTFADALKLVAKRGELMGTHGEGEMAALPLDLEAAQAIADRHFCTLAGFNLPDQTVVGGSSTDLDALVEDMAELYPKKRTVRLKTEGAFHTYYMVSAAREFRKELTETSFMQPTVNVLSNYKGGYHPADTETIRANLFFQLFHPVDWVGCLQTALNKGANLFIEFGGGIGNGESPADKRPNLEGIIKKFTRREKPRPEYIPAINVATINAAAAIAE